MKREKYGNLKGIAFYSITIIFCGLLIVDINEDYVSFVYETANTDIDDMMTVHTVKLHYSAKKDDYYFRFGNIRYYLNSFMRCVY